MSDFTIEKRNKATGVFFYIKYYDKETGRRMNAKSADTLAKELGYNEHITKKTRAVQIAQLAIEKHLDGNEVKDDPVFSEYVITFWDYDNSPYIQRQLKKDPNSIGRDYCNNCKSNFINHALPYLPKGIKASQVRMKHIERIQNTLVNEYSVSMWQNTLKALSRPIGELKRTHVISENPLEGLDRFPTPKASSRARLTDREVERFTEQIANDIEAGLLDKRCGLAILLSLYTGMRQGEILALRGGKIKYPNVEDKFEDEALILVDSAYAKIQGFKCTKGKESRIVPCPKWLADELVKMAEENPHTIKALENYTPKNAKATAREIQAALQEIRGDSLVFYSEVVSNNPVTAKLILKAFYKELDAIGLTEKERQERGIVFHSCRHFFNSKSDEVNDRKDTQLIMGHKSDTMTEWYNHVSDERILEIGQKTIKFIPTPKVYTFEKEAK